MELSNQIFSYNAFIVFDNGAPDRLIATKLQKSLLAYRTSRILVKQGKLERLHRIVLDPKPDTDVLSNEVKSVLAGSEFLIIVCSPRAAKSRRVTEIIAFFHELGRKDHIQALLIEGEPKDSFPALLREERITTVTDAAGNIQQIKEIVEPLAADIRSQHLRPSARLLATERLRILAPMIGCGFRDLKPVHLEELRKKYLIITAAIAGPVLIFSFISLYLWLAAVNETRLANKTRIVAEKQIALAEQALHNMYFDIPAKLMGNPPAVAAINEILNANLELVYSGKQVDHSYDRFLVLNNSDDENAVNIKARILRRFGRIKEALATWDYYERNFAHDTEHQKLADTAGRFVIYAQKSGISGGIYVLKVLDNESYVTGKICQNDVIIAINGIKIDSEDAYRLRLEKSGTGKPVTMTILRTDSDRKFSLVHCTVKLKQKDLGMTITAI